MTYLEFMNLVRNAMLQNIGKDMYSDDDMRNFISMSLISLFLYLNKSRRRFFSGVEESLSPTVAGGKEYKTTHSILGIINDAPEQGDVHVGRGVFIGSDDSGKELNFKGYFLDSSDATQYTYLIGNSSESPMTFAGIKTSQAHESIFVRYARGPRLPQRDDSSATLIDCPFDLLSCLKWHVMASMYTQPYLEQGANLASFWMSIFEKEFATYCQSYGINFDENVSLVVST